MPDEVLVIKLNTEGEETWRYTGRVLERGPNWLRLEAFFNRPDTPFHGILLAQGDRFLETYFADRWYNIYEIHDRLTDDLKGWYCNVTRPAVFEQGRISYVDLALDLLVYPDQTRLVLDEDEFAALPIDKNTRNMALAALRELEDWFENRLGNKNPLQ
jgi:predicted RNA-binding protein associated with RNAse of E/G family